MRFAADHMLGSLARWLRFLGFDTAYPDVLTDKELAEYAEKEDRILLTRDKDLARKVGGSALYIHSTDINEQLEQVISAFDLTIENELSRCSLCNTILVSVDKETVRDKVPENIFKIQNEFWECCRCSKYYWPGTHYKNIKDKLEKLKGKTG
jgi:uncharacterized protein with PIN domain